MHKQNTYYIVNNARPLSNKVTNLIKTTLNKAGWKFDKNNHQYLIVVGGDGTYVRFLRKYYAKDTKIICVNTGTVGFYAKFNNRNLSNFVKVITNENNYIHPHVLTISINNKLVYNAMNEMVVQSLNTIKMDIKINSDLYEKYMGTGILIATRTGSTGQGKSDGGAIIFPNVDAIELVEIAPTNHSQHRSFNAPTILNGNTKIELFNFVSAQRCDLIIDGIRVKHINPTDHLIITKQLANFRLCFSDDTKNYINKLQQTFIKD